MKNDFERSRQIIENKNIEDSKKYIQDYLSNVFLKEFEIEKEKQIDIKIKLTSHMKKFTQEFLIFAIHLLILSNPIGTK